jgi:hypothetical protein
LVGSIITLSEFNSTLQKTTPSFCPFNLDIYSNNGRSALHEAVEEQNCRIVHLLVSNGANVNLPYEEVTSRVSNEEHCFVTRSTPLSCACRLGNVELIEYLLNAHATDKEFLAYNSCKQSYLIGHLLKYRVLQDNEFKLTKRQLTSNVLYPFDEQFWSTIDLTKIWMHVTDEKKVDGNNNIPESNYSMENVFKRRSSKRYQILSTGFEQIKNRFSTRPVLAKSYSTILACPIHTCGNSVASLRSIENTRSSLVYSGVDLREQRHFHATHRYHPGQSSFTPALYYTY